MELGFTKANSANLPRLDLLMLGEFLTSNKNFSSEFKNIKTSVSSGTSYGDDAVCYVQLKREGNLCILKGKICPEYKVNAPLYEVTLVINECEDTVKSIECRDCSSSQGGCKHAIAFLMWAHRRSEDPSTSSIECYWMNSMHSMIGATPKYITAKEISNGEPSLPSNIEVLKKFLKEGIRRKVKDCELINYYISNNYVAEEEES